MSSKAPAPPIEWSGSQNIKWKAAIPGSGLSTPIVWGDQIFVVTAVSKSDSPAPAESGPRAQNQRPRPRPGEGGAGPGPGAPRARGGFNREAILKEFDKDGDGQLNDEERAAMRAQFGQGRRVPGGQRQAGPGGARPNRGGGGGRGNRPAPVEHDFQVMALDRNSGAVTWTQTAATLTPHEGHHPTHGFASASPVTDGKHLWVSFGSRGIFCYSLDGDLVWETDLGDLRMRGGFGEAVQPAIAGDHLLLTWDQEDQSYLIALEKSTGEEVWRKGATSGALGPPQSSSKSTASPKQSSLAPIKPELITPLQVRSFGKPAASHLTLSPRQLSGTATYT